MALSYLFLAGLSMFFPNFSHYSRIQMANRDRYRVGGIIGFGNRFQVQDIFHHFLNLIFVRPAVSRESLLHLKGRIGKKGNLIFLDFIQYHPAGLGDGDRGLRDS